jgi:hypothetical protein
MFQAVRHWWHSGRGQHTVRLFVFELVVVMIGVLAAQQIQGWAQKRAAVKGVEGLHEELWHDFSAYRTIAQIDQAAIPCFEQRIDQLLTATGGSTTVDPALLTPARLAAMGPDNISPENFILLRERYGNSVYDRIGSMEFDLKIHEDATYSLNRSWYKFERLDPRHGSVSEADRSAAREAATDIRSDLADLKESNRLIQLITGELGISTLARSSMKPVGSCAAIWRTGNVATGD